MKKLLLTLLSSATLLLSSLQASAVTIDELINANTPEAGYVVGIEDVITPIIPLYTNFSSYYTFKYASSGEIKIGRSSTADDQIVIQGIFKGNLQLGFIVNEKNNTVQCRLSAYKSYILDNRPVSGAVADLRSKFTYFQLQPVYWNRSYNVYSDKDGYWTGNITTYSDRYEIKFEPFVVYFSNYSNMSNYDRYFFDGLVITLPRFEYNTNVTDRLGNVNRSYKANVDVDWTRNTLAIENFACSGHRIQCAGGGMSNAITSTTEKVNGTFNFTTPTSGTVSFPQQQIQTQVDAVSSTQYNITMIQLCPSGASSLGNPVTGTFNISAPDHADNDRWHKNDGGNLVTNVNMNISLNDYKMMSANGSINLSPWYNTKMNVATEYTANPTLNTVKMVVSEGFWAATATINEKNEAFVDHYELIIVPKRYTKITSSNEFYHNDHGHTRAFNISVLGTPNIYAAPAANAANSRATTINMMFHPDDLVNTGWSDDEVTNAKDGNATFYIKTIYTEDSGLKPTFHDLTYTSAVTGVDLVEATTEAIVTAGAGTINVANSDAVAEVYTPAGALVYSGLDREIAVAAGMYIVRVGNNVTKLVVK